MFTTKTTCILRFNGTCNELRELVLELKKVLKKVNLYDAMKKTTKANSLVMLLLSHVVSTAVNLRFLRYYSGRFPGVFENYFMGFEH